MNMLHILTRAGLMACALALAGCSSLPVYQPTASDADVRIVGYGSPRICMDKARHNVETTGEGLNQSFKVPTDKRVTLTSFVYISAGNASHSCSPSLSFIPESGKKYVMHTGLGASQRCFVELVQDDPTTTTGVAPVKTLGHPEC